ncbi:hypothetical protein MMC25_004647 [Agyrium rufum]|nr:hypothetical protein [Agyrium rufum]
MPNGIVDPSTTYSAGKKATCLTGYIPITVKAMNAKILAPAPADQYQTSETFVEMQQAGGNYAATAVGGTNSITGTYNIFSKVCFPNNASAVAGLQTVQLLIHGATLDHTYWDTAPGYSYVDAVADAGYATFSYDALGTGLSDHPDPLQVVQAPLHVEVAHQMIYALREATLEGRKFKHLTGVGHSAGSTIMQGVTTKYPADYDAIILSGTSTSFASINAATAGFALELARLDPSGRFSQLPNGYFSQGAVVQAVQFSFWRYPNFDPKILQLQFETRQTNTLGELLTLGSIIAPSTGYTGPVDVVNGLNDFVFCGGDCTYPTSQAQAVIDLFYPAASKTGSQTYLQPDSGHVLAQHYNAADGYNHMIKFLQQNGIV